MNETLLKSFNIFSSKSDYEAHKENLSSEDIALVPIDNNLLKGEPGEKGERGEKGEVGLSAYELAVTNGFLGTEAEWLSSLKGDKGEDGRSLPIGFEYFTVNPNIPNGSLPLFGAEYSREVFPDLWEYAQSQTGYIITEEQWQALSNQNGGNVPFYSSGDGSTTFRVPSLKCWIKGANGIEEVGSYLAAGLPNIEGSFEPRPHPTGNKAYGGAICMADGAFTLTTQSSSVIYNGMTEATGRYNLDTINMSAQLYNPIYGNSDTVQPPSIAGMWLVKAYGTVSEIGNADAVKAVKQYTRLENRINSIDFNGIYIVEARRNATEWYRIWSDGWIEQGGEAFQDNVAEYVIHLLKPYINTDYFASVSVGIDQYHTGSLATKYISVYNLTTTSFTAQTSNAVGLKRKRWYTCGQGEVPAKLLQQAIKGESAYEIAVRNGFIGTETEWLASLKGRKGDKGDQGESGNGLPIGFTYFSINPNLPSGSLPLFGGLYSREIYADLWNYAKSQQDFVISEDNWQALSSSNNGNVPFYSFGDGETTFRVPSLSCWIKGANGLEEIGSYIEAGLPNINASWSENLGYMVDYQCTGAVKTTNQNDGRMSSSSGIDPDGGIFYFDASWSNPIYGNSDTVQPPSIIGMWLVKAYGTVINEGSIEISSIESRLSQIEELISNGSINNIPDGNGVAY